jgi:hypothetical protein
LGIAVGVIETHQLAVDGIDDCLGQG